MNRLNKIQVEIFGEVLSFAEIGLTTNQFCQFKKQVFKLLHRKLIPMTNELLAELSVENSALNTSTFVEREHTK